MSSITPAAADELALSELWNVAMRAVPTPHDRRLRVRSADGRRRLLMAAEDGRGYFPIGARVSW